MYKKDTLVTGGKDLVVLVCKNKKGLENFRIFHKGENFVDVGYSLVDVRTPVILQYVKNKIKMHHRTYYVLDLNQDKIFRADAVMSWARFPQRCSKHAIVLAEYTDAEFWINEENGVLRCASDTKNSKYWDTKAFADEEDMPGSIHILDLAERKVHKVPQLIFLN